jgi:methylated-DNA-protein-cysteine methyltransferase related protein
MNRRANEVRKKDDKTRNRASSDADAAARFEKVFEKIYRLVLRIPRGRVMTYGQIARLLEERYSPRLVGWAMHATPQDERNIPWHRVINSRGAISTGRVILHEPDLQRLMLEAEGVVFDDHGHCDLSVYQWSPRQRAARAKLNALRVNKRASRAKTKRASAYKISKKR